jgi:DNA-directed RNA polymerase beta' subunit
MRSIKWTESHRNFDTYNDVVLDKIVEINIIPNNIVIEKYPKVYDLTIPSTLNFGLANGLQVRDTSTTGYIQRRLIKGLEDLMVGYDMTLRTNKNKVVQFTYGDDGIDPIKVENQNMSLVGMSIQDIYAHYNFPEENGKTKVLANLLLKNTMTRFKTQLPEYEVKCKEYTDMMIQNRDDIVKNVFKNKDGSVVNCPVAFMHIINNVQGQQNINSSSIVDITPLEAFDLIENCYANLEKIRCAVPTRLFKTLFYFYLSPKELLYVKRFNCAALKILLDTISLTYKRAIVNPGEMVGMIAAQSIGEPTTQMTLNSVTYETEIIVRDHTGQITKHQIGDFIENKIKVATKTEYYKDKDTTYSEVDTFYEIPSCAENGEIVWKQIEAVTRHPVINKDGSNTMLKVTTKEEREVIVTKAKSLLKLVNGKIITVDGDTVKVGDYLPVSILPITFAENKILDLKTVLPPTEYIYSTEIEKAKEVMHEYRWWTKHQNKTFTLPYKRSDSFVAKVSEKLRHGCKTKTSFEPGCVYMMQTNMNDYQIPDNITLDYNFGYFIGAYAAEGCTTKFQISIANNDTAYFAPILELCKQWNITTKIYKHEDKNEEGWTSQDLRIYNTVLCRILEKLVGNLSHNKFISNKIVFSNKECLLGFLDAYIGGDGSIDKKADTIIISSVSKEMLIDVQQILNNLEIYSFIGKPKKIDTNNRGSLDIKQLYTLNITGEQTKQLASMLNMKISYKQENLKGIMEHNYTYKIHKNATLIPNEIDGKIVFEDRSPDKYSNLIFDKIKSIEEVSNTTNYAYDLTIADTRNFNIYNGLALSDTFHFAGVASKSNVTRGVPRIEEILSLSSEPKNPSLTVFLKKEDETNKEKAQSIMYMLEHTKMDEIIKSIEICFDPDNMNTMIQDDEATMLQYQAFETMMDECAGTLAAAPTDEQNEKSKWIIRMEMDAEVMLEKNISMDDINFTLKNSYGNEITCVYSDYNADKLVFRIRMNNVIKNGTKGPKKIKVNPLDQSDQIYILKNFQDQLLNNIIIRGVKDIKKVILRKIKDNVVEEAGTYKKQDIWVLDTVGTNILDVLALDYIDPNRTFSNDIIEIFNVFGIEAARQTIYNELVEVIEFDGTYINFHHLSVLCDRMTFTNKLISIFRHGINNDNIGPIAKASFEETPEMFLKAARHGELDMMRGVSANVMVGQEGMYGTNAFQVVLDMNEMKKLDEIIDYEVLKESEEIDKLMGKIEDPNSKCGTNTLKIQNNVASIKTCHLGDDNAYNPGF